MFWVVMDKVEVEDVVSGSGICGGSVSYFGVGGGCGGGDVWVGGGRAVRSRGGNVCGISSGSVSYFDGLVGGDGDGGVGGGDVWVVGGRSVGSRDVNSCGISGGSVRYFVFGGGGVGFSGASGGDSDSGCDVWRGARRGQYRIDGVGICGGNGSVSYVPDGGCGDGGFFNN